MLLDTKRQIFVSSYIVLFQIAFIILMGLFGGYHYEAKNSSPEEVPKLYASKLKSLI